MPKKLSIIIPVYNEEKTIVQIINRVLKVPLKNIKKEIIIVDDFSQDNSRNILKKIKDKNIKIFFHKKNFGKGYAIRTALKHATGDLILIQDADFEYKPEEYPKLLEPIIKNKAKVVYGVRFTEQHKPRYKFYYLGNLILTSITNILYNSKIKDMETCYKVFKKEIIRDMKLKSKRFDFEPEITAKILKKGYKIFEVPITYKSRSIVEGKKISWKDGLKAVYYLIKYRFMD
jgi:glycosyltransferase involved in cell wall biosynthesis